MTRDQVNRTLSYMEHIREASCEAETAAEERKLTREYAQLWQSIEPYVSGKVPYSTAPAGQAAASAPRTEGES